VVAVLKTVYYVFLEQIQPQVLPQLLRLVAEPAFTLLHVVLAPDLAVVAVVAIVPWADQAAQELQDKAMQVLTIYLVVEQEV